MLNCFILSSPAFWWYEAVRSDYYGIYLYPILVFVDEPPTALDGTIQVKVLEIMKDFKRI